MRIAHTYDVTFHGKLKELETPAMKSFWIQPDQGDRFEVSVPNHPKILEHFIWLDENDCLRHLRHISPTYTTNVDEVESIQNYNAMLEENAYAMGSVVKNYSMTSAGYKTYIPGLKPVPELTFTCTWTFWSREHAVMFKLARGGEL
jgi:hypothetical protein